MRLSILAKILDLIAPRQCVICKNRLLGEEEILCSSCLLHLPRTRTWVKPYDNEMAKMFWKLIPIERCCTLFYYKGHSYASNLIYQLKYNHHPEIGVYLGKLLAQEGRGIQFFEGIDAIVPIPLTKKRYRERGYNQSERIAAGIHGLTNLPVLNNVVERMVFIDSQTHKNRWERNENVQDVFKLVSPEQITNKHILIIDDICTTGATIISCCQEMMKAGGVQFSVLTVGYAGEYT